jgi:hypothetical protein
MSGGSLTKTFVLEDRTKGILASKQKERHSAQSLIDRVNNAEKEHNKMLTVTRRATIRERDGKWSRRVKGIPLPPLIKQNVCAVEESTPKVRNINLQ